MRLGIKTKVAFILLLAVIILGFAIPEHRSIPVKGATNKDWNHGTFWHEPWGRSGVHKGIDIFSSKGTPAMSSTAGIVLYKGEIHMGGKIVVILGPKWRLHYYAHLDSQNATIGSVVRASEVIGTVGDSGNAKGKTPHLHYSIVSLLPYIWNWDLSSQGWKKMFYLNPSKQLINLG